MVVTEMMAQYSAAVYRCPLSASASAGLAAPAVSLVSALLLPMHQLYHCHYVSVIGIAIGISIRSGGVVNIQTEKLQKLGPEKRRDGPEKRRAQEEKGPRREGPEKR